MWSELHMMAIDHSKYLYRKSQQQLELNSQKLSLKGNSAKPEKIAQQINAFISKHDD